MPQPRVIILLGLIVAATLTTIVVLGVITRQWVLVGIGASAFLGLNLLVQLDTWRRTRSMRNFVRDQIRTSRHVTSVEPRVNLDAPPAPVTADDLFGTIRMMQAQYTGRLDRLQTTVEHALAELADEAARRR